jgi:hypothetical protein
MKGQMDVSTPEEYLDALEEPRKSEVERIHRLIRETVPELEPHIRNGILGYGPYRYRYASGREGDWFKVGLASNKNSISLYICGVINGQYVAESYRSKLPKADIGKSCIRFKRFDDLDIEVIREMLLKTAAADFGVYAT